MTYRLVSLTEAQRNLRYEDDDVPTDLGQLVEDASQIIINYLDACALGIAEGWTDSSGAPLTDSIGDPLTDSSGNSIIPGSVRRATLLVIGALDKDREGQTDPITPAVVSLLTRYRDPTAT
jgi:hypothetical protein